MCSCVIRDSTYGLIHTFRLFLGNIIRASERPYHRDEAWTSVEISFFCIYIYLA